MPYADREGRIIYLQGEINNKLAEWVVANLLLMESDDPRKDIQLYIDSPGGSVHAGYAIYDTMQLIKPDVVTIVTGLAASMASILLAGGTKGKRYALPHAKIMIHQPLIPQTGGKASELEIIVKDLLSERDRLVKILSQATGQPPEKIRKDIEYDNLMTPEEAREYGIIDKILGSDEV